MLPFTHSISYFIRCCLLALGLLAATAAAAQPAPVVFGLLDTRDLTAAPFAHDSSAAVILCDYATTRISPSGYWLQTVFERTLRIKVLRKAGTKWGTLNLTLKPSEQLNGLRGCTYNLAGSTIVRSPLESDGKFVEGSGGRYRLYRLLLPNVREGSVVDFTYTILNTRRAGLSSWEFQRSVPVRWSEYRVSFPQGMDFHTLLHGTLPLLPDSVRQQATPDKVLTQQWDYRWAMREVPAFVDEPFISSPLDYLAGIEFSWAGTRFGPNASYTYENTWAGIDQWLLNSDYGGRALEQQAFLKEDLARLPGLVAPTLLGRIAAVRALVMQHVKYNADDDVWLSRPLRDTYRNSHQGNAADVNLLLVAALRAAHIDANPLLLSTRDYSRIDERFPTRGAYNYVLAHVLLADGQDLLLDATDPSLPCGLVPERCLNGIGRLLPPDPKAARWINLRPAQRLTHLRQLQLSLSPTGELRGSMHEEYGGYAAARQRAELARQGEASYGRSLTGEHPDWNLTGLAIGAGTAPEKPLTLDYQVAATARSIPESTHYLSPLAEFGIGHNPFTASTRRYPVDFGMAQEETLLVTLHLPPGYALAALPSPQIVDLPDNGGRFVCTANSSAEGVVELSSRLVLRQASYPAAAYAQLRELYRLLLEKQAEQLEIRKQG